MRPSVRRSLAAAAIVPLMACTAIACGGNSDDTDEGSDSSAGSTTATQEEAGDADDTEEAPAPGDDHTAQGDDRGADLRGDAIGVEEFAEVVRAGQETVTTAAVDVRMDSDGEGSAGDGILDLTGDRDALHLSLSDVASSGRAEIYMIDGTVFRNEDASSSDKFIQLDPELHEGLSVYALFHPYQLTDVFLDHLIAVEHRGGEEIEGTTVEHYLLTVDPDAMLAVLGPLAQGGDAMKSMQQHIWLDADARMVQSRTEMAGNGDSMTIEWSLSDFGGPEAVEPPPASQVDDPDDLR